MTANDRAVTDSYPSLYTWTVSSLAKVSLNLPPDTGTERFSLSTVIVPLGTPARVKVTF